MGSRVFIPAALTKYFESAEQVIVNAGALFLAHGLSIAPKLIEVILVCKTAEHNYTAGEEVIWVGSDTGSTSRSLSIVAGAANVDLRYGNNSSPFSVTDKTTGNMQQITVANWRMKIRAWA